MKNERQKDVSVLEKEFLVENQSGIHCRAAVKLAEVMSGYDATVQLISGNGMAGGASILDIMALGCVEGSRVTVRAKGRQAREVLRAVERMFHEKFGEE